MLIGRKAEIVPHVVALAETVKRQRYKASGEELKQFVDDDVSSGCVAVVVDWSGVQCMLISLTLHN